MPVSDSSKKILELASQFIELQQDLELANALARDLSEISNKINDLAEANIAHWDKIQREATRLKSEISLMINQTKPLEQYKAEQQALDTEEIDTFRREVAYNLALRYFKNKEHQALEAKRLGKRARLFEPLLTASHGNYLALYDWHNDLYFNHRSSVRKAFDNHLEIKQLKQAIQSNESLDQLKERIVNLINHQKKFQKTVEKDKASVNVIQRLFDQLESPTREPLTLLSNDLNKVKKNINLELYPIFGKQIDALENYIQNLKESGIDPKQSKQVIFKSDRAEKYRLAEKLKNDLIAFEGKNEADKKADTHITVEMINKLIKKNEIATGSRYLHRKGRLDKILKEIKDEIGFSVNRNYSSEYLKAKHLKNLEKMKLKEAMASDSGYFFRDEMIELTKFINQTSGAWRREKTDLATNKMPMPNPKDHLKIAKQLRRLLLNSNDLADKKIEILKNRLEADMKEIENLAKHENYYGLADNLFKILKKIKDKVDHPKKLRP